MKIFNYKIHSSMVMAGKVMDDDIIEDWENPKFGRYWWFWAPRKSYNGGKFSRNETIDFSINWLCFSVGFIAFYEGRK